MVFSIKYLPLHIDNTCDYEKNGYLLWMAGLVFAVTSLFAQDIPVGVVVAFKKGNSQELNRYLGEKVNLVIQNRSESVDRQAAEGTLAAFFQ